MADEISNRTLAILLVGAIVVSLFGTFISLNRLGQIGPGLHGITGMASTGDVNISITGKQSFNVRSSVNFGIIQPNSTGFWISTETDNAWAGTGGQKNCTDTDATGADACYGIEIENDGNVLINLSFQSDTNAAGLIGGTGPAFSYKVIDRNKTKAGGIGCNGTPGSSTWATIASATDYGICNRSVANTGFRPENGQDMMMLEFNLTIPSDAPVATDTKAIITVKN